MSSDFIYNTNIFNDDLMLNTNTFNQVLDQKGFEIISKIMYEAGQSLFKDTNEMVSIPAKYLEPPIHIAQYKFTADLGPITKQNMTMVSLHNPLNITFDTMSPLALYFNPNTVGNQWTNFLLYYSRIPIFCKCGDEHFITNLSGIFHNDWIGLNSFFVKDFTKLKNIELFREKFKDPRGGIYLVNNRTFSNNENENLVYKIQYSDGRYLGVNSPQSNDWYLNRNDNLKSDFNNVSPIKCILEINNLAACWNETKNFTLANGAIFINITPQGNVKFTGKYFKKSPPQMDDTGTIHKYVFNAFKNNEELRKSILSEIDFDINIDYDKKFVDTYYVNYETKYHDTYKLMDYSVKNLFLCVNGLEEWMRRNFALWLSGIYGHYFDFVLRYFSCTSDIGTMNKEAQLFKMTFKEFSFVQRIGSPLASYCYEFKVNPEQNILLGYNLGNMGGCVSSSLITLSDHIDYNTIYKTRLKPVGLFPVVYQNVNFFVNVTVWRSFRHLLSIMKTRQQRDIVMDHLNTYGRRCFTILDPYGIFLHFHNETKGLGPSDK